MIQILAMIQFRNSCIVPGIAPVQSLLCSPGDSSISAVRYPNQTINLTWSKIRLLHQIKVKKN